MRVPRPAPPPSAAAGQPERHPEIARGRRARRGMPAAQRSNFFVNHTRARGRRESGGCIPQSPRQLFPTTRTPPAPAQKLVGPLTLRTRDFRIPAPAVTSPGASGKLLPPSLGAGARERGAAIPSLCGCRPDPGTGRYLGSWGTHPAGSGGSQKTSGSIIQAVLPNFPCIGRGRSSVYLYGEGERG